jgi:DNA-directed RNA polymerase subunit K/omega
MNSDDEVILETDDVVEPTNEPVDELVDVIDNEDTEYNEETDENYDNCLDIIEQSENIEYPVITEPSKCISKNKLTRYEFVRIIGERVMQLTKGAKPLIKQNKQSENYSYSDIAIEELKTNMIPFKIRRFVKDHYEIWNIDNLDKKHLEPLFY